MEATLKLIERNTPTEGTNKQGNTWRKALVIFETLDAQYPKKVAINFFNSRIDSVTAIPIGTVCKVDFSVESRQFGEKWYTDCTAFAIEPATAQQPKASKKKQQEEDPVDDLPW